MAPPNYMCPAVVLVGVYAPSHGRSDRCSIDLGPSLNASSSCQHGRMHFAIDLAWSWQTKYGTHTASERLTKCHRHPLNPACRRSNPLGVTLRSVRPLIPWSGGVLARPPSPESDLVWFRLSIQQHSNLGGFTNTTTMSAALSSADRA